MSSEQSSKELINSSKDNGSSIIIMTHNGKKVSKRDITDNKLLHNKETNDLNSRSFINSSEYAEDIDKFEMKNNENIDYNYDQLMSIASEEEKKHNYNECLKIYNNILDKFPKEIKIEAYRGKALSLAYVFKINDALLFTENTIKSKFSEKEMLNVKAEIYFISKDYNNSLYNINKSIQIDENNEESLVIKMKTLYYMKNKQKDLNDCLEKINKINPNNPHLLFYSGRIFQDKEKYQEAIELYLKSLEHYYKNIIEIYENLGICYQKNECYKEALFYYEKFSLYIPKAETYYNMGLCSIELKLYNKAVEYFTMCISLEPKNTEALNFKGLCYIHLGQNKKAERNFLKAIDADNNFHKAYLNLIKFYISKRAFEEGENIIKNALNQVKNEEDSDIKLKYINELKQYDILIKKEKEENAEKKNCSCQGCIIF